jgi:hypothetical protein
MWRTRRQAQYCKGRGAQSESIPKAEESKEVERELGLCWQVAAGSAQIVHLLVLRNPMVVLPLGLEGVVDSFLVYSPCQS